jgi:hypothetical protein
MKRLLIGLYITLNTLTSLAQTDMGWCATPDSGYSEKSISLNSFAHSRMIDANGIITIPVVFHVLYNETNWPGSNLSDARINSQIARLNTDFRKLNSDINQIPSVWATLPADVKIEFKLACIDPQGNATTGIVRKYTPASTFSNHTHPKLSVYGGDDAWPTDTYLNIWTGGMEGFFGFATFPWDFGGTTSGFPNSQLDGTLLDYSVVGENNGHPTKDIGRVAVHEVGHWLGLWHIYNGNCFVAGDEVSDTPPQESINTGCPSFPKLGLFCSSVYPGEMFMNYLDQTYDNCMYLFTLGQSARMRSYIVPIGSIRNPFLDNYFGMKRFEGAPACITETITVNLSNPMCLPAVYTINSGPVYLISSDNQKIVLGINSGVTTGTVNLTVTAPGYNYMDDYVFNFEIAPTILNAQNNGIAVQKVLNSTTYSCSVTSIPGSTFIWTIEGGTIISGQGTTSIIFEPDECWEQRTINSTEGECFVLIKVKTDYNTCEPESQIIFQYDYCPPNLPCCQYVGQTCCWGFCGGGGSGKIYPNPAKNQLIIEASREKNILSLEATDILGNIILRMNYPIGQGKITLNINQWKPGQYFIRIFNGKEWSVSKIKVL